MNLLQEFVDFLLNQKLKPSLLTVKNYKADVGQFISWFEKELKSPFDPSKVTLQTFERYKKIRDLSKISIERHISSLRKFFSFLKEKGITSYDPLEKKIVSAEALAEADPWMLRNFKSYLYEYKKSNLTIKNYVNDVRSFFVWLEEVALIKYVWNVTEKNLLEKINPSVLEEYKQRLILAQFSTSTINRKLSSLRNYVNWAKSQGFLSPGHAELVSVSQPENLRAEILNRVQNDKKIYSYSSFPPKRLVQKSSKGISVLFDNLLIFPLAKILENTQCLFWKAKGRKVFVKSNFAIKNSPTPVSNIQKEFYAPLDVSTHYLPTHKRIWHYIRHARPKWYKQYHSYSFTHYFHFSILMILSCAVGFGMYNRVFADIQKQNAVLGASTSSPPRILSFQGKLTDSSETPITQETTILFSLYNDENASSAGALWQENNAVKPDSNGVFSVFLGKNAPIPDTAFSQNSKLFLGITVGNSPELKPRQELATVPYASNTETLQGLEPITNSTKVTNVVLALDSSGNLSIGGSKAHTFQTIGAQFILSGKILSLTTIPGSNSNVEIVPNGVGKIDLSKPIQNSTNNNNLSTAVGSVEFDDTVAILATTSAQAALYINQNSTGVLISASTSGTAKFVVENDGTGKFSGDLAVNGGDLTSTATTFSLLDSTVTTLNLGGAATTINLGVSSGTLNIKSNVFLTPFTSNGGILYTNGSGKILQVSAGSSTDCLIGGSTPSFSPCSSSSIVSQANGAAYFGNTTLDFLIGSSSTSSALIKFSGTSGNNSWVNTGNLGIGTTSPVLKLDVHGSQSATAAAQIYNTDTGTDADGLVIKLGNTSTSAVATSNHFISFETSGIGIVGSVQGNGGKGVTYATSGVADFAEYFKKDKNQPIEYGSIVCLNNNGLAFKCNNSDNNIIGVASERPAFLGGENLGNGSIAVGLVGQVETFVALINGEIKAGDMLTLSDIPGVAVKTTNVGQIVGKALEDLNTIDESKIVGFYDPQSKEYRSKDNFPDIPLKSNIIRVAKIYALVNVSWYDPDVYITSSGSLSITHDLASQGDALRSYAIKDAFGDFISRIGAFSEIVSAKIKAGIINTSEIVTNSLIVTADSIIVNGQNLKDYIVNAVRENNLISPIQTNEISTNVISPLSSDSITIKLGTPSGSLVIQNASGSAVASIDSTGKIDANAISVNQASISGNLNASEASISGTLRAGSIIADSIQGLDTKISNIYSTNFVSLASYSAQLSYIPDLAAQLAEFSQGLMVFGPTSLSDLAVTGNLSIGGTMFVTENSIETLGTDLYLQSLRQGGISIMGGLIFIDTNGDLRVKGDVSISGKLAVNIISPLSDSNLVVQNASGSAVLSVNQTGDIVASGSGTFAKLNFSLVQPVLALSPTEVLASSSAGVSSITPYYDEITIKNRFVTDKSVIYITPVGTPSAQSPFLIRQTPQESFTVGVESPNKNPILFNWLIVN